jgi:CTP:molybdopterin cytidylyltransferase MocA
MLAGIILTVGNSQAMESPLAIMPWGDETFLQAIAAKMRQAEISPLFAVLGVEFWQVRNHCRACDTLALHNEDWALGPFSSLQMAARQAPASAAGVMVARISQPHLRAETYAEVAQAARKFPDRLVLACNQNRRSYPFVIPSGLLPALMAMPQRCSINNFVDQFANRQLLVPVADPFVHDQINSPVDLVLTREKAMD